MHASDTFAFMAIMAIPIVAIIGGITAGIVRTVGQQRLAELAHRERIAALERGVDPTKLPPPPSAVDAPSWISYNPLRRYHGLLIGGIVCVFAGFSIGLFLNLMATEKNAWAIGLIPLGIGLALLLSAMLVKPKNGNGR